MRYFPKFSAFSFTFCLTLILFPILLYGQENTTTGISGFYIPEKNNLNIGFTSFDISYPGISKENISLSYGMRLIGATTGKRGGFFAFGYFSELLLRPSKRFQLGATGAVLAGGGASAPDKDGWLLQGTVFSQYMLKSGLRFQAGLNYAYVSSGVISGFSPLLGLNWKLRTVNSTDFNQKRTVFAWNAAYGEFGIATFKKQALGFIGTGANWTYGKHLTGDFTIHALANAHGGYMQTILSGGPAFTYKAFRVSPAIIAGLGGGGGVKTKGGGLYGAQLGLFYMGKSVHAGIKYQYVKAFSNAFDYNGLFVAVGKTFGTENKSVIKWYPIVKAYLGKEGFGNIGARFVGYEYKKLRLMGATYWAFTHNRGAYAEGLFEATLNAPGKWPFYLVTSWGAGAGGGINRRTASLIYSAGIGVTSPWKKMPFQLEAAYWTGGNIPNWSISLAYSIQ